MYGQFFILFGLILVGYYCNKKGYLPMETNKNVGNMVMRVTIPAMLITTIAGIEITDRVLKAFLFSAAGRHISIILGSCKKVQRTLASDRSSGNQESNVLWCRYETLHQLKIIA